MSPRWLPVPFLSAAFFSSFIVAACSSGTTTNGTPSPTPGGAGTTGTVGGSATTAGTTGTTAGTTATAGSGTGGSTSTAGASGSGTGGATPTAGTAAIAGASGAGGGSAGSAASAGAGGMSGAGGGGSGGATGSTGCNMLPGANDSSMNFVKHDVEVTGVDPAFIAAYAPVAGSQYNWTHRNYYMRLPTNYDPSKVYPVLIGGSGCGGTETVGSEGGYSPLGVTAGETEAIQVALSYVKSSAANPDCGGAVFSDNFPNSPDVPYLQAVIKDIESKYCADPKKIFESGYSSGAFESITQGCANSDKLRAFGVQIGGGLRDNGPKPCKGPIAAMYVVGLQDNENPIGPAPAVHSLGTAASRDEVLTRNGCNGSAHMPWDATNYPMCETYTGCPAQYPVIWCAVNADHGSPTGDGAATYVTKGMWKFFSTLP